MNMSFTAIESLLSAIPALAKMASAHAQQELDQAASERRQCIATLPGLRAAEQAAKKKLDAAIHAFEAARAAARDLESKVSIAEQAHRDAQGSRSNAERDLLMKHGDGDVQLAAYRCSLLLSDCDKSIQNLEQQEVDRTMGFARLNPKITAKLSERRNQRKSIKEAVDGLHALLESDNPPHEIQNKVAALLQKAGFEPNPVPVLS